MNRHHPIIISATIMVVVVAAAGCTSMRTVDPVSAPSAPAFGTVKAGDTVAVRLTDGRQAKFVVDHVDGEAIVSVEGIRYPRALIQQLQRQSVDYAKSVGLFFLLLGVIGNALL